MSTRQTPITQNQKKKIPWMQKRNKMSPFQLTLSIFQKILKSIHGTWKSKAMVYMLFTNADFQRNFNKAHHFIQQQKCISKSSGLLQVPLIFKFIWTAGKSHNWITVSIGQILCKWFHTSRKTTVRKVIKGNEIGSWYREQDLKNNVPGFLPQCILDEKYCVHMSLDSIWTWLVSSRIFKLPVYLKTELKIWINCKGNACLTSRHSYFSSR